MIRLTKGAITMLLAQYKGILKHAFLVSCVSLPVTVNATQTISDGETITLSAGNNTEILATTNGAGTIIVNADSKISDDGSTLLNIGEFTSGTPAIIVGTINVEETGSLTANNIYTNAMNSSGNVNVAYSLTKNTLSINSGTFNGTRIDANKIDVNGGELKSSGGVVNGTITAKDNAKVNIGTELVTGKLYVLGNASTHVVLNSLRDNATVGNLTSSKTGLAFIGRFEGSLTAETTFGQTTAMVGVNSLRTNDITAIPTSEFGKPIYIGKNAFFLYGANDINDTRGVGSRTEFALSDNVNGLGSIAYFKKGGIQINSGSITVDKNYSGSTAANNTINLGLNSAIVVGGSALTDSLYSSVDGSVVTPVFKFTGSSATVNYTNSSKILLDGVIAEGNKYWVFDAGSNTLNLVNPTGETLKVYSVNGLMEATIDADGNTTAASVVSTTPTTPSTTPSVPGTSSSSTSTSTPITARTDGFTGVSNALYYSLLANAVSASGIGAEFVQTLMSYTSNNGKDLENTARLASFAGGYNAAMLANNATTDTIETRQGIGNKQVNQFVSNGTQGTALWLSPIYMSVNSDSYKADNLKYGADTKLVGIALGADVSLPNNFRLGGMFNLGAGEAKGKGSSNVKNDFDFFSLGVYGGYNYDNFAVNSDLTYTKVSNDFNANTTCRQFSNVKGKADTNVLSLGLTGQYTFNTQYLDVTPHLGLRYTSLDLGNYDIKTSSGVVGKTEYKKANLVSMPVGITLSKEFTDSLGKKKVRPSLDLTVTSNMGDTKEKYTTTFTGMKGAALSSEYVDTVTYKVNAGVDVELDTRSNLNFGLTYLGSKNQNGYEFNAKYQFNF